MKTRSVGLLLGLAILVGPAACVAPAPPAPVTLGTHEVHLRIGRSSRLSIGSLPTFDYDGRDGVSVGTMTLRPNGTWGLFFPAERTRVPPLPMVAIAPWLPLQVTITPLDMVGSWDPCSGAMELSFDARFQPEAFDVRPAPLHVVTPLSTETVTTAGRTLSGSPVDRFGRSRLVGVAPITPTGDPAVDLLLSLPAPAVADLEADLDVVGELPTCADAAPPTAPPAPSARVEILAHSALSFGPFGPFEVDGGNRAQDVELVAMGAGRYRFSLQPTPLQLGSFALGEMDGFDAVFDACTGAIDVAAVPVVGNREAVVRPRLHLDTVGAVCPS